MRIIRRYLILRASGDMRIVQRRPTLNLDEIAYPIEANLGEGWGRIQSTLTLHVPENPFVVNIDEPLLLTEQEDEFAIAAPAEGTTQGEPR